MNRYRKSLPRRAPTQGGFTLVELMVTVGIALFLLGGLVTIVENVRTANMNQTRLAQLQDEQRFAMTVIADAIQAGGYFADPTVGATNFGPSAAQAPAAPFQTGWPFTGSHVTGVADAVATDNIATRFQTGTSYGTSNGPILCNGTDTSQQPPNTYQVQFSVAGGVLLCSVNNGVAVQLVSGVQAMAIYYGVKRDTAFADYNVDTYVTWDQMVNNDFTTISAVRVVLTFTNPLFPQANQPATITLERVVEVMARAGMHT
jgi:type IV pilus assembly protein PilW